MLLMFSPQQLSLTYDLHAHLSASLSFSRSLRLSFYLFTSPALFSSLLSSPCQYSDRQTVDARLISSPCLLPTHKTQLAKMVFVFVCRNADNKWTAKATGETDSSITAEGESFKAIEKALKEAVKTHAKYEGPVQVSHTLVTPKSSVFVCSLGAAPVGGVVASSAAPTSTGQAAAPAEEAKAPEPEEESEEDMDGFSLFD
eukprot:m.155930 g.155930  ORF g.155930 m.155930 type:complete len:200 (+) comp16286_c3_seq7:540-1139(+)